MGRKHLEKVAYSKENVIIQQPFEILPRSKVEKKEPPRGWTLSFISYIK